METFKVLLFQLFDKNGDFRYFYSMEIYKNIKLIREEKGFKQIDVANHIKIDKSAYSKIEKGNRSIAIHELQAVAQLFNMTIDQIVHFDGAIPQEVMIEDKSAVEQMRLIQQLDDDDKQTIFKLIDKMLTYKKFKDFVNKNLTTT